MLEIFQVSAEAVGTSVKRFTTITEAVSFVKGLAGEGRISTSHLPPEIREAFSGTDFATPTEFADSFLCVSLAQAGIAATGSLMLDLSDQHERSAASLPTIHAVFLKKSAIVPDLYALHDVINKKTASSQSTRLSITTGPSRTADIERVLTIGVHGPKELYVLVLEGE
ncbi:MAG TPA: LUD domain-containing protein [Geobacteraceae bacterium]|nr:LUD domain-containing protein [Geobacteraceae bacterium]